MLILLNRGDEHVFFLNLIGGSGDIYMALFLCRFSYDSKIIDRSYGFDVVE